MIVTPTKQTALMFDGAAALIAQEVGMLDLIRKHESLVINQEDTFICGLSSGGLLTLASNAGFSSPPSLEWEDFKRNILFPLTNADVFTGSSLPLDTTPLRELVSSVVAEAGYSAFGDVPFPSAVIITSIEGRRDKKALWANTPVPSIPPENTDVSEQIREHALELDIVDLMMCTSAIPSIFPLLPPIFPPQNLRYFTDNGETFITNNGDDALFEDGGTKGTFANFQTFFDAYGQTFENIYYITPRYPGDDDDAARLLAESIEEDVDLDGEVNNIFTESSQDVFIREMKEFNQDCRLANNIYLCRPNPGIFSPMNFGTQQEQYNKTIEWGVKEIAAKRPIIINFNDIDTD